MISLFGGSSGERKFAITVQELHAISEADELIYLLDVRTAPEFEAGRLAFTDALIPYDSLDRYRQQLPDDNQARIYCFCRSGHRSGIATKYLRSIGYQQTYNVEGGIIAWQQAGLPIKSGPE